MKRSDAFMRRSASTFPRYHRPRSRSRSWVGAPRGCGRVPGRQGNRRDEGACAMKFGPVPVGEAEGGISVHSIRKAGVVLKKGTVVGPAEIAALRGANVAEIVVARLESGDVSEDQAAAEIAAAVAGEGVRVERAFTGRANLFAESPGVLVVDKTAIDCLNLLDECVNLENLTELHRQVYVEML